MLIEVSETKIISSSKIKEIEILPSNEIQHKYNYILRIELYDLGSENIAFEYGFSSIEKAKHVMEDLMNDLSTESMMYYEFSQIIGSNIPRKFYSLYTKVNILQKQDGIYEA